MKYLALTFTTAALLLFSTAEARLGDNNNNSLDSNNGIAPQVKVVRQLQLELESYGATPNGDDLPLGLCEGDCDEDEDCDVGLVCFQRDPRMAVPGCIGGEDENSRTDFCVVDPSSNTAAPAAQAGPASASPVSSSPTFSVPIATTSAPVPAPVPRPNPPTTPPVTVSTSRPPTPNPTVTTPSPTRQALKELVKVGNNGNPSSAYPLSECQGDCDEDSECNEGLVCFHRDGGEPVPGCLGDDGSRNDYCIRDPNTEPTTAPTLSLAPTARPSTILPTVSNQPSLSPTISPEPTMVPSDMPSDVPTDFPSSMPSLSSSPTMSAAPTGVPSGSPTVHPIEGIRLKLYWEEGYNWQDETIERKWCMTKDYNGFPGTGKCWHGLKTEPCHPDMVYVSRCENDDRQLFSIVPMPGGTQYQIAVFEDDKCLERIEYSLVLRECNYMNPLQRFWLPRGALYQKRFELSPITLANHCVTQAHHPKSGEVVELHPCSRARSEEHLSSFWNLY